MANVRRTETGVKKEKEEERNREKKRREEEATRTHPTFDLFK